MELFAQTIAEELDFRLEAENMVDLARTFAELGQRGYVVPRPHPELVTRRVLVMERLDGFRFDDVVGMRDAGVDTEAVIRTGMIATLEGAILKDLPRRPPRRKPVRPARRAHRPLGLRHHRTSRRVRRQAFLRLLMGGAGNDVLAQLAALRDLRCRPTPTSRPWCAISTSTNHLSTPRPCRASSWLVADPAGDEGAARYRRPLPQGAHAVREEPRVPRRGHRTGWRPTSTSRGEIASISIYFATHHGDRIAADVGIDPRPSSSTWPA